MTHFPHWPTILAEWKRVVKPGGRVIFDMLSMDHSDAFEQATGNRAQEPRSYQPRVRTRAIGDVAATLGLRIVQIVPYGAVSTGIAATTSWLPGASGQRSSWEQFLLSVGADANLFDMLMYIEEAIIGSLTSEVTGRFIVVLENEADAAANDRWLERDTNFKKALRSGFRRDVAAPFVGEAVWSRWAAKLATFCKHPANLVALSVLYGVSATWGYPIEIDALLPAHEATRLRVQSEQLLKASLGS